MSAGAMQCEACRPRTVLMYVRERRPQQGAQMCHTFAPFVHFTNPRTYRQPSAMNPNNLFKRSS
jgi:hypothetical protein